MKVMRLLVVCALVGMTACSDKQDVPPIADLQQAAAPAANVQQETRWRTPGVFAEAFGGKFRGYNSGEFGGKLTFEKNGRSEDVLQDNVIALVTMDEGILAFTGLAHLGSSRGHIYLLRQGSSGFVVDSLYQLDGAPQDIRQIEAGRIVRFRVYAGGWDMRGAESKQVYECRLLDAELSLRRDDCAVSDDEFKADVAS